MKIEIELSEETADELACIIGNRLFECEEYTDSEILEFENLIKALRQAN